jgi:hypothetical protein
MEDWLASMRSDDVSSVDVQLLPAQSIDGDIVGAYSGNTRRVITPL